MRQNGRASFALRLPPFVSVSVSPVCASASSSSSLPHCSSQRRVREAATRRDRPSSADGNDDDRSQLLQSGAAMKPAWLESLLTDKFFTACIRHGALKKNERNIFCVDCVDSICQHCLSNHQNHKLLQVRRYVYHDVIRLQDIQKLIDCSLVQTYIINSAKVVFLNQRPQPRPPKGLGNACDTCDRSLQDSYRFCSVACKVDSMVRQGKDLSTMLPHCNSLQLSSDFTTSPAESEKPDIEEELSPNSILGDHNSQTSSGSTNDEDDNGASVTSMATTPVIPPKKVRSSRAQGKAAAAAAAAAATAAAAGASSSSANIRRKSTTPHRSPLS